MTLYPMVIPNPAVEFKPAKTRLRDIPVADKYGVSYETIRTEIKKAEK